MAEKKDGGPAFPVAPYGSSIFNTGMSLRDWFAGQIAMGILAGGWANTVPLDDVEHAQQLAAFAYDGAVAMLNERDKYGK